MNYKLDLTVPQFSYESENTGENVNNNLKKRGTKSGT